MDAKTRLLQESHAELVVTLETERMAYNHDITMLEGQLKELMGMTIDDRVRAIIKKAALDYIARQGTSKDEWYHSDREMAGIVLNSFLLDINIDITEEVDALDTE